MTIYLEIEGRRAYTKKDCLRHGGRVGSGIGTVFIAAKTNLSMFSQARYQFLRL